MALCTDNTNITFINHHTIIMENNQKDFMKNRPGAEKANQYQDVYGSQSTSTRTTVTTVITLLIAVCVIYSIIRANWYTLGIFGTVLVALIIALIVGHRADRYNAPVEPHDSPDAIFKEHEE